MPENSRDCQPPLRLVFREDELEEERNSAGEEQESHENPHEIREVTGDEACRHSGGCGAYTDEDNYP